MRRTLIIAALSLAILGGVAWATQVWRDNVSMGGFSLTDPTEAGAGLKCAQFDNTGKLLSAGAPCSSGGAVTSVTGTAQRISATPTTGAVIVDTIGGFYSGVVTSGNENLGSNASGVEQQVTTAGVAVLSTYQCVASEVQYGAPSGGGLAQSPTLLYDTTNSLRLAGADGTGIAFNLNGTTPFGGLQKITKTGTGDFYVGTDIGTAVHIYANTLDRIVFQPNGDVIFGTGLSTSSTAGWFYQPSAAGRQTGTPTTYISGNVIATGLDRTNNQFDAYMNGAWQVFPSSSALTASHVVGSSSVGNIIPAVAGTDYQAPLVACTDYVSLACVTGATDLGGTNVTPTVTAAEGNMLMRGNFRVANTTTPATPSAGLNVCWTGTVDKNIDCKNDTGAINHGVRTNTGTASQWVSAIADNGFVTTTQPAFTDVGGQWTCAQSQAFTGSATKASASCATKVVALDESGGANLPIGAVAADQQLIRNGSSSVVGAPRGQVRVNSSDTSAPDYLTSKIVSSGGTIAITAISSNSLMNIDVVPGLQPYDYTATYGGQNFGVNLPDTITTGGANPDFWLRPNSGFDAVGGNLAAQGQVWDFDTGGTYGTVDLNVYVYQCGITTTAGVNDFTFTVTKNGSNTGVNIVASCPNTVTLNTNYTATGSVSFSSTDRVGIRGTVTNTGVYSSGALRATVHARLRP